MLKVEPFSVTIGDVSLSHEDVETLAPRRFLSDLIIAYAFQELERSDASVRLVQPASVFMAACGIVGDDLAALLRPLALDTADTVYLPVNNNDAPDRAYGGSHWSLLVFRRASLSFHHYDSYHGHNDRVARRIAAAFARALNAPSNAPVIAESAAPQQSNSFDCGIFVICVAEALQRGGGGEALAEVPLRAATRRDELRAAIGEAVAAKAARASQPS